MSIIEHAQMLPTATLFSKNHTLAGNSRRTPFDFAHPGIHRLSSPAGNSTQSGNGGVVLPVTPDTDLPPSLGHIGCALMEVSTPEDIQGTSGGSSMMPSSASLTGTGLGEEGVGRVHLVPLLVLVSFTPTTICSCRRNLGQQNFATMVETFLSNVSFGFILDDYTHNCICRTPNAQNSRSTKPRATRTPTAYSSCRRRRH
jgi:hypothetical protein